VRWHGASSGIRWPPAAAGVMGKVRGCGWMTGRGWLDVNRSRWRAATGAGDVPSPSPSAPPPGGRLSVDRVPGGMSINHRLGGSLVEILSLSRALYPGLSSFTARPLEGAGGGAERAGRWGLIYVNRSTGDTPRQGRGMFHPPYPASPSPRGAIVRRYSATGEISFSWFQARNSPKFLLPRTRPPSQSPFTARPLEGAGGGRASGREVGVDRLLAWKDVFSDTPRQGRGMFHPPPRQPLPHGGDCPSIGCRGG